MISLFSYSKAVLDLFFPHYCAACFSNTINSKQLLCTECFSKLEETNFFKKENNILEQKFAGRIPIQAAASSYFFIKHSVIQTLIHQLKYKGNKEIGLFLGKLTGTHIMQSERFKTIDVIIPVPIHKKRMKQRGYNQTEIIAKGIASVIQKPIWNHFLIRKEFTETQTHKSRISRWQTIQEAFTIDENKKELLKGTHFLLVDDVATTGATLEACGLQLLRTPNSSLSFATVAYTL